MRANWMMFVALALGVPARAVVDPLTLVALGEDGRLVTFAVEHLGDTRGVTVQGLAGRLVGIDRRPVDGRLYGLSDRSDVYRIDPASGACTLATTLTVPFDGGSRSGLDFTPQADRLRLLSAAGRNLRVNVGLGATAADAALHYAGGDPNASRRPRLTAAAYTNNRSDAPTTKLYALDADLDVLVIVELPNDGVVTTVGPLGVDLGPLAGFEIVTEVDGTDRAYAASGATLWVVDLTSGRATPLGSIADGTGGLSVISLAAAPPSP